MTRLIKRVVIGLLLLGTLAAAALTVLLISLDPNSLKPHIESELSKQGLQVEFSGPLSWRFYPNIAIDIEALALLDSSKHSEKPLAKLNSASLRLSLSALLKGKIDVASLAFSGLELRYSLDKQGISNWQSTLDTLSAPDKTSKPSDEASESTQTGPSFSISTIELKNVNIHYEDALSAQKATLQVSMATVYPDVGFRKIELHALASLSSNILSDISFELNSTLQHHTDRVQLDSILSVFTGTQNNALTLNNNLEYFIETDAWKTQATFISRDLALWLSPFELLPSDSPLQAQLGASHVDVQLQQNSAQESIAGNTQLTLHSQANPKQAGIRADIAFSFNPSSSKSRVTGEINLAKLDLNDFISDDTTEAPSSTSPQNTEEDTLLPTLKSLSESLKLDLEFTIAKLLYKELNINNLKTQIKSRPHVLSLEKIHAEINEGTFNANSYLDLTRLPATFHSDALFKDIDLDYVLKSSADIDMIQGLASGSFKAKSEGSSVQGLLDQLSAQGEFEASTLRIASINIIQNFCDTIATLSGKSISERSWDNFTEMRPVNITMQYRDKKILFNEVNTSIDSFHASAKGEYDLNEGRFNIPFNLQINDFAKNIEACDVIDSRLRSKIIPIRCRDKLESMGLDTCRPDSDYIKKAFKAKLDKEIEKKKDKLEDKAGKEAKKLLEKHLKKEDIDKLKSLFK